MNWRVIDSRERALFTGIWSGDWVHIEHALTVSKYLLRCSNGSEAFSESAKDKKAEPNVQIGVLAVDRTLFRQLRCQAAPGCAAAKRAVRPTER
jgi:hypothetical protein